MKDWNLIIGAIGGTGGIIGLVAFFVSPASERIAWRRKGEDRTTFLASTLMYVCSAYDKVCELLAPHEPGVARPTSRDLVEESREQLETIQKQ